MRSWIIWRRTDWFEQHGADARASRIADALVDHHPEDPHEDLESYTAVDLDEALAALRAMPPKSGTDGERHFTDQAADYLEGLYR